MNVNRFNEKNSFILKKVKYPGETIMDADYVDDLALLAITPA